MGFKWVNILSKERFFDVSDVDTQYFNIILSFIRLVLMLAKESKLNVLPKVEQITF